MIELLGWAAAGSMVTTYALEDRGPSWTAAFAVACVAASSYAVLTAAWPFAALEAVWAAVALRRARRRRERSADVVAR